MAKTFAIGPETGKLATIWCEYSLPIGAGSLTKFTCINGAWNGAYQAGMGVRVQDSLHFLPAKIVWEGEVPREFARDYNDAIAWINAQIESSHPTPALT